MDDRLDRDLSGMASRWQQEWVDRELKQLYLYTIFLTFALTGAAFILGVISLVRLRRTRKALESDPSARAAIFAKCDKHMLRATRGQWSIAIVYIFNALAIWIADAAIGVSIIWSDVSENPGGYDTFLWLELAIKSVSMLAIFIFVFIAFPMAQLMLFSYMIGRNRSSRNITETSLASVIPEARVLTTHFAHIWAMLGFLLIAFWPVFESTTMRLILAEAIFGSALTWSHAAFVLCFRAKSLERLEVPRDRVTGVKLYGQHVLALPFQKQADGSLLPVTGDVSDEKQALLGTERQ